MANKYIIHGETYCGDGTTSAAATSTGGVGALNSLIYAEGTAWPAPAVLVAGDVVYIRSKDAAGADITRTLSANSLIGSATATGTSLISWVLDAGTVWSGISGTLTYACPSTYKLDLRPFNRYIADVKNGWIIKETNAAASYKNYFWQTGIYLRNIFYDFSTATTSDGCSINIPASSQTEAVNLSVKSNKRSSPLLDMPNGYTRCVFNNPTIELTNATQTQPVFRVGGGNEYLDIFGGSISGTGASTGVNLLKASCSASNINVIGLQYPKTMGFATTDNINNSTYRLSAVGIDGGIGAAMKEWWGEMDSRNDNFYPTLNATIPNSTNSPWSWKLYPSNANLQRLFRVPVGKFYTEDAATKTVTLEMLVADTFAGVNADTVRLDVMYIDDATGLMTHVSSHNVAAAALTTSTANWSATTYGAVNLLKRKLVVTTPTTVKKDTIMVAVLTGSALSGSANDILFIDPDVSVL